MEQMSKSAKSGKRGVNGEDEEMGIDSNDMMARS